jgi:predicted Zn-dependent protease
MNSNKIMNFEYIIMRFFFSLEPIIKKTIITMVLGFNCKLHIPLFLFLISCIFHTQVMTVDGSSQESSAINRSTSMSIDLCCTWDKQISDGILKYKLVDMQEKQENEIREAFDSWNKQLTTLRFVEIYSHDQKAEIVVTFGDIDNGNTDQSARNAEAGQTAGQSVNNLNQSGYITNAKIILSDKVLDKKSDSNTLFTIILHEIGHALGLGHANFDDLMNPLVTSDNDEVSVCDVKGVFKTNELVLKKNASSSLQTSFGEKNTMNC